MPASSWAKPPASAAQAPESSELICGTVRPALHVTILFRVKVLHSPTLILAFSGRKEKENQPGVNSL